MQVSCSYPPWCSSLALSSAQGSKRNSRVVQVGLLFSRGVQNFWEKMVRPDWYSGNFGPQDQFFCWTKISVTKKWSAWTDILEILVPRTNFSAGPKFPSDSTIPPLRSPYTCNVWEMTTVVDQIARCLCTAYPPAIVLRLFIADTLRFATAYS